MSEVFEVLSGAIDYLFISLTTLPWLLSTVFLFGAVSWLYMYPTLVTIPWLWSIFFFNVGTTYSELKNAKSLETIFLLLLVIVAPQYITTLMHLYKNFVPVSVVKRLTIVLAIALSTGYFEVDAFPKGQFIGVMFLDVFGGIAHSMCNKSGLVGCFKTCGKLMKNTPTNPSDKALKFEALVGMVYGIISISYAALVSNVRYGTSIAMIATVVQFIWIGFHGCDATETPTKILIAHRLLIAASFVHSCVDDYYGALNDVFNSMAVAMFVGIFSPYLSAAVTGSTGLYFIMKIALQGGATVVETEL